MMDIRLFPEGFGSQKSGKTTVEAGERLRQCPRGTQALSLPMRLDLPQCVYEPCTIFPNLQIGPLYILFVMFYKITLPLKS